MNPIVKTTNQQVNQRNVRFGIWLLAVSSIGSLLVIILILSFVEPDAPQGTMVNEVADPVMDPLQAGLNVQEPILLQEGNVTWQMNPRAESIISARIVGKKEYRDWQAAFAPIGQPSDWVSQRCLQNLLLPGAGYVAGLGVHLANAAV